MIDPERPASLEKKGVGEKWKVNLEGETKKPRAKGKKGQGLLMLVYVGKNRYKA